WSRGCARGWVARPSLGSMSRFDRSVDDGLRLLAQVERQVPERSDRLAGGAAALPAAERLVARPGARGGTLRAVHVGDPRLDAREEMVDLVARAVEAGGETVVAVVRALDAFVNRIDLADQ